MKTRGRIDEIHPILKKGQLKVVARISMDTGEIREAYLPDREVSAILPRSILLGKEKAVPQELLKTIDPMINKMARGRPVRVWSYQDNNYASFLSWRSVRFLS